MRQLGPILVALTFFCFGILGIVRPQVILRWVEEAHPDRYVNDEVRRWLIVMVKMIGVVFLVAVVFLSIMIAGSFY